MKTTSSSLRGILFDWDGTIVDSSQSMLRSVQYAYHRHLGIHFPKDLDEFRQIAPMRLAEHTALYAGEHAEAVAASYIQYYREEGYKYGKLFSGMRETLAELRKRGYALGVATNTSRRRMQADLDHLELQDAFDVIVTSDDTVERKPHPAPLLKGAERLRMEARELAYMGDFAGDMIAARAAGMFSVAVQWGGIYPVKSVLAEQPDQTVQRSQEILQIFQGVK